MIKTKKFLLILLSVRANIHAHIEAKTIIIAIEINVTIKEFFRAFKNSILSIASAKYWKENVDGNARTFSYSSARFLNALTTIMYIGNRYAQHTQINMILAMTPLTFFITLPPLSS